MPKTKICKTCGQPVVTGDPQVAWVVVEDAQSKPVEVTIIKREGRQHRYLVEYADGARQWVDNEDIASPDQWTAACEAFHSKKEYERARLHESFRVTSEWRDIKTTRGLPY